MSTFSPGTVLSFALDEYDILTIDGQTLLEVTPTGRHYYQTQTFGHQVIGPFGVTTTITLTGQSSGSYLQSPSNQPSPVTMVDISAAQQASPTAAMLASTTTLFQLNSTPYTIYQSNGSALVAIGAGGSGVTTAAALTDIASINLPVTNAPLAAALAAAGAPTQSISYSTTIPLNAAGNGKIMPATVLNANSVFTVGASPIEGGNCTFNLIGNGSNLPDLSAFVNANGYSYSAVSGANNIYTALYTYSTPLLYGQLGSQVAIIPGQVTALTAGAATGTTQPLTWTAPATGGTPTNYLVEYRTPPGSGSYTTFSHTASAATAQTVTGLSAGTSYEYRVSGINTSGTGTASATITASTVAVPGTVTGLTLGTATLSTQPLSWSAPSGTPTDYVVQYRTTAGPGSWIAFTHTPSSAVSMTITGLGSGTSYDYRVAATNAAGTGSFSSTATGSTSSVGSIALTKQTVPVAQNLSLSPHFKVFNTGGFAHLFASKSDVFTGPSMFGTAAYGSFAANGTNGGTGTLTWTDADTGTTSSSAADEMSTALAAAYGDGIRVVLAATGTSKTVRIWGGCVPNNAKPAVLIRATLSDASFAEQTLTIDTGGSPTFSNLPFCVDVVFNSSGSGTMTIQLEAVTNIDGGSKEIGILALAST